MQRDPASSALLREAELRVTRPRLAVLAAVGAHPHADTDALLGEVRKTLPEVSRQAVYDVLAALTAAGLVRRIQPAGSTARYESRVADNHHHIVCRTCGAIGDVDCAVGDVPCLTPADDLGFIVDEAEVIYWGRCADCAPAAPRGSTAVDVPVESPPLDQSAMDQSPMHQSPMHQSPMDHNPMDQNPMKEGRSV